MNGAALVERFSDAILRAMNARNITQRELANRLGVTEARVCQMLNRGNLTLKSIGRIVDALECEMTITALPKAPAELGGEGVGK